MRLLFDIEANGLLKEATRVHCIVARDIDTKAIYKYRPDEIEEGIQLIAKASTLVAHNGIDYDLRLLKKLHGMVFKGEVIDTLVYARTMWPDTKEQDFALHRQGVLPAKLIGSHSLKAWGYRLGVLKGDFAQDSESFSEYSEDMLDYCVQDTEVTLALYNKIVDAKFNQEALDLETKIHTLLLEQEETGFPFDVEAATKLYAKLNQRKTELEQTLQDTFEPTYVELKTKTKIVPFNPASRQQIADRLMKRGWKPTDFTDKGQAKVDEKVLEGVNIPEAKLLIEYLLLNKRIGQISTGKNGWLKLEEDGRIHGRVNHMGAVTSRCTHSSPNLAQVPAVGAPYGDECRSLFTGTDTHSLFGTDASGLELRCLAHYMSRYDDGAYGEVILNGDIHTQNQEAAGLPTRNNAKTFIYGFLYGAGDEKIGQIIGKGSKEGRKIKSKFLKQTPALKLLKEAVSKKAELGFIRGLDGRIIPIRHSHAALNTLLQSCGAIICKAWYVRVYELINEQGVDARIVAFIHDEIQILVRKTQEELLGRIVKQAMKDVETHFKFRIPLDCDYSYGNNWAETH